MTTKDPKNPETPIKNAPRFKAFKESKPIIWTLSLFSWPRKKIRALYAWVVHWAETKQAGWALGIIAFIESSFFPIPPDPLLIATTTVKPKKYLRFALICTVGSILGGIFGYLIGVMLFETVGQTVINTYHLQDEFVMIGERYEDSAFLAIFTAAFTPIPYKLITISAGVFNVNFFVFVLASIIGRGGRFFAIAFLMHHFGKRYKDTIEKYVDVLSLLFVLLLVGGVLSIKYLL